MFGWDNDHNYTYFDGKIFKKSAYITHHFTRIQVGLQKFATLQTLINNNKGNTMHCLFMMLGFDL